MSSSDSSITLRLTPGAVPLASWRRIHREPVRIELAESARAATELSSTTVAELVRAGRPLYGVNTGFGKLAHVHIDEDRLYELQRNLILSHSAGTGPLIPDEIVRLVLVMKAAALAQGYSGVRWEVVEALLRLVEADVHPCIPSQGSVGASGDLAPLAHMAGVLMGVGRVRHGGREITAAEGLRIAGLEPLVFGPKEGVALINGTQVSTALALTALLRVEGVFGAALVTGALSVEASCGDDRPFDARIHAVRRQRGQIDAAAIQRDLLADSPIRASRRDRLKIQDPYCLRCQPQVMGACLDLLRSAGETLWIEANAVSDNPLVFAEQREVLSGGNFHAEPVAFAADTIALAICEIGSMSERRQAMLIDEHISGLPAFLIENSGLNSGFMIAQVTAAALAAENKTSAHPASIDSIPTSANQEDHVSMACHAAARLHRMADNLETIVALEWLAAAQGVEFHRPLAPAPPLAESVARLRAVVPRLEHDRSLAEDIAAATSLLKNGALSDLVTAPLVTGWVDEI